MMSEPRRLQGEAMSEAERWISEAAKVAMDSSCERSRRGVVIVRREGLSSNAQCIGKGANGCEFWEEQTHYRQAAAGCHHGTLEPVTTCSLKKRTCERCIRTECSIASKTRYELCHGVHAEKAAIDDAIDMGKRDALIGATLYHIALDSHGRKRGSGEPSCTLCAREILRRRIKTVVLWQGGDTYAAYEAGLFEELSLRNMASASLQELKKLHDSPSELKRRIEALEGWLEPTPEC